MGDYFFESVENPKIPGVEKKGGRKTRFRPYTPTARPPPPKLTQTRKLGKRGTPLRPYYTTVFILIIRRFWRNPPNFGRRKVP